MQAQQYLQTYYAQRADQRGNHARRASGDQDIRQAEAFQRVIPQVVEEL
jgi:4-oxalomesaconate hydratase